MVAPIPAPPDATFSGTAPSVGGAPYRKTKRTKGGLLKLYCQQIEASAKWRKAEKYDDTWHRLIDLYRGKQFTEGELSLEDKLVINVAFSTVNVIGPSVAVNHPKISVLPRFKELAESAPAIEAATNYWWQHYNFRPEFRLTVDDFLIIGHGWAKVGYRYVTEDQPTSANEQSQYAQEQHDTANALAETHTNADQLPTENEIAPSPATKQVVIEDRPFMERVSPFDIFVDPEATSTSDLKWIAQRIVRPLEDVKDDSGYNSAARHAVQADASSNPRWRDKVDGQSSSDNYDDGVQRVTVWEYYDIRNGLMCVFAQANQGKFLVDPVDMPYSYGHPFRMLRNYEVPDYFYPIGDLEQIEPIQKELNLTRSAMMNHRKRYARKYFARQGALTDAGKSALESNQDNEIVYIEDERPFNEIVEPVPIVPLDAQMYNYSATIESDLDLVSGVSEYQRGSDSATRKTATEASIIQDAVNARSEDKLAIIEDFITEIARATLALAQTYLTGQQVARYIGADGAAAWIEFDRDTIQGEFDFEVAAGSTQPQNETQRRQQALQLTNVLAPYVGIPGGVNPAALIVYVLREGFGIQDPNSFIMPAMPPPQIDPATGQPMPQDPNAMQGGAPGDPAQAIAGGLTLPVTGQNAIPPKELAQLQGQVGLSLGGK